MRLKKLPFKKGDNNLIVTFESPIVFTRVGDGWTRFGGSLFKQEGYRAILFRMPKISFYWRESRDSDF